MKQFAICAVLIALPALLPVANKMATGGPPPAAKPRARDLGVPFEGTPGPWNAITDVKGIEVGHTTLIQGEGKLVVGKRPDPNGRHGDFPTWQKFQ